MRFIVQIDYREPGYEARQGGGARPYRWRYRIDAPTESVAMELALVQFRWIETLSSVGWIREIVALTVERALPDPGRSVA